MAPGILLYGNITRKEQKPCAFKATGPWRNNNARGVIDCRAVFSSSSVGSALERDCLKSWWPLASNSEVSRSWKELL
jgi:hypothetical protein